MVLTLMGNKQKTPGKIYRIIYGLFDYAQGDSD